MKAVLALCFLSVATAAIIPFPYTAGVLPYSGGVIPSGGILPLSAGVLPTTYGALPTTYSALPTTYGVLPTTYVAAPQIQTVQASVVAPGYVAKTPGSEHIAPLPAGLGYASHHINLAKAPGTQ
ncbi:uncharacterized protein LOC135198480 [Macrobrachium nipponense]|uniref:uncharacterized protein LOC135198480 n=1 Tax=Macrobrachium nipponense TaxID=159736 RepID=UPI0030C87925